MVVIAEATRRLLGDLFEIRYLGEQNLKGIQEKVPVFAVLGERAMESRFAARQGAGLTPIVGRDQVISSTERPFSPAGADSPTSPRKSASEKPSFAQLSRSASGSSGTRRRSRAA